MGFGIPPSPDEVEADEIIEKLIKETKKHTYNNMKAVYLNKKQHKILKKLLKDLEGDGRYGDV